VDGFSQSVFRAFWCKPHAKRVVALFITTIAVATAQQHIHAQVVTTKEPASQATSSSLPNAPEPRQNLTLDPSTIPQAIELPPEHTDTAILQSNLSSKHGNVYQLSGDVEIDYRDHILRADNITYNKETGDCELLGHIRVTGGNNDEYIQATHGSYNLQTNTGTFYDVTGSTGLVSSTDDTHRQSFQSPNPFLFSGRMVVKTGPENYDVYDGAVTSCALPRPDWQLFSHHFSVNDKRARASNSVFRVLGIPLLPLPYVTHPTDTTDRQSGILIPVLGFSSASNNTGSKGLSVGEQAYLTLGRSADVTVGLLYYSLRGFSENATIRYRGPGDDFFNAHFSALQDRGFDTTATLTSQNGQTTTVPLYVNQGGQDVTTSFRWKLRPTTRFAGDAEYLSSYVYRQVFTENFNQSVSTDITSTIYAIDQQHGYSTDIRFDRYEGLKVVPIPVQNRLGEEVKVFHAPSIDFSALDRRINGTPFLWHLDASAAGLKRIQPNFKTSGMVERLDVRPEILLPLHFDGWSILASGAAHETFYSRSRRVPYVLNPHPANPPNATPVELTDPVNRIAAELNIDIRPPAMERTFTVPTKLQWLLGTEMRHTIEPEISYHAAGGINNFLQILRFDTDDLASDTNELNYAFTQHLYFRPRPIRAKNTPSHCQIAPNSTTTSLENTPISPEDLAPEGTALNEQSTAVEPVPQAANDANGIPNASATAPDLPTRTHRNKKDLCADDGLTPQKEWFSWKIQQKFFFDSTFGNAVLNNGRNIFDTTLALSGVAFLTEPRDLSPVISRMRFRTSGHTDFEWDLDYDTGAKKINSSNIYLDIHEKNFFGGLSYALLNAPGRTYTETINPTTNTATGLTTSAVANFSQMRLLAGFGSPSKPGLALASGAGLDLHSGGLIAPNTVDTSGLLQYLTVQASYNWNCCGFAVEYRKYDLGDIRNEGAYRFNFTLANIGTAGNLRRSESLF
jgi:LPS-assembly protein